jgi:hypothetical protein
MYWWYALDPAGHQELRTLLQSCPNPLDPHCACSLHTAFRTIEGYYSSIRHEMSPTGNTGFARMRMGASPIPTGRKFLPYAPEGPPTPL